MRRLAQSATSPGLVYFSGGASAVLLDWRASTIDIDFKMDPEQDAIYRAIPDLKEQLDINVELASPDDFIPPLPGWRERSVFIAREGNVFFHHYDFYAQALSKIERRHTRDVFDVEEMIHQNMVDPPILMEYFNAIEPDLYRYPSIDPPTFRGAVEAVCKRSR